MPYRSGFRTGLFDGQTILIPGGGGGLGRCIAHELASLGARVVLAGRTAEKLERVRAEITADGGIVAGCHALELRDEAAVVALVERVLAEHGPVDGLVNAAGGQFPAKLENLSLNGWNAVLHNNLTSYFLVAREVYRQCMRERGGSIVNIGADWEGGMAGMGHNGAARAGLSNLTATAGIARRVPLGRHGTAAEISAMAVFLLSEMAAYVTGADFRVDGGIHNGASSFLFQPEKARNVKTFNGFHLDEPPALFDR